MAVRAWTGLLALIAAAAALAVWLRALARWDGTRPCAPEDCETCPFPRCAQDKAKAAPPSE